MDYNRSNHIDLVGKVRVETESGSVYLIENGKFSRNGSKPQRILEYRLYNEYWFDRYNGADDTHTTNWAQAAGKYLFVHGEGVDNWIESTQIVKVEYPGE